MICNVVGTAGDDLF